MPILRISSDSLYYERELKTRSGVTSEGFQDFLRKAKELKVNPVCLCQEEADGRLAEVVAVDLGDRCTIRRNSHYEHSVDCIFYKHREYFYDEEQENYKESIFYEVSELENRKKTDVSTTESGKVCRNTFNNFAIDMFSEVQANTFINVNKQPYELKMYTDKMYFRTLLGSVLGYILASGKKLTNALTKNVFVSVGILDVLQDINGVITIREYKKEVFTERDVLIDDKRLHITQNRQKNHGKILSGPYAYIATLRYNPRDKTYKIIRIFTYAIVQYEDKMTFVESELERKYALELFHKRIPFIKPINGNEYVKINEARLTKVIPTLNYRPDFIEFHSEFLQITEVCGFPNNMKYMKELIQKELYYRSLEKVHPIYYYRHE